MKVYIVRHTSVAVDGRVICYGATDVAVQDTFEQEAQTTVEALRGVCPDAVFSSPLSRAYKLASYVGYPDARLDDRLRELDYGDWEMKPLVEILQGRDEATFFLDYVDCPMPGGESLQMQYERVRSFLEEQKARGYETILVFCHAGVINCAKVVAGLWTLGGVYAELPDFASVTELEV